MSTQITAAEPHPTRKHNYGEGGFTLAEMMIVFVIIVIFGTIVSAGCQSCGYADEARNRSNNDALAYVRELHPNWTEVRAACQSTDSDNDGYVSCTIVAKRPDGSETQDEGIECRHSVYFDYARGCRPMRVLMNGRGMR